MITILLYNNTWFIPQRHAECLHTFRLVRDFKTPTLPAEYLRFLVAFSADYERHPTGKREELHPAFEALIHRIPQDPWCRMAMLAALRQTAL